VLRTGFVGTLPSTNSGLSELRAQGERFIVHKAGSISCYFAPEEPLKEDFQGF
jgi:hypothetical protein